MVCEAIRSENQLVRISRDNKALACDAAGLSSHTWSPFGVSTTTHSLQIIVRTGGSFGVDEPRRKTGVEKICVVALGIWSWDWLLA